MLALLALAPLPAQAQERSSHGRQTLAELAYVLGESHALRQACSGTGDQYWRNRMIRLVEAEQPDAGLDRQIKEGFNAGFVARRSEFSRCGPGVKRAQAVVAGHGRDLSARLARAKVAVPVVDPEPPTDVAEPARPR
ncbi:TIGR02301 family protein [Phenylobacterium sp. LH3H17]|uniref:TIGR02301 family protein n=1 Tax=Phenylobacterium sp. LH3H17 TaxID=2903901 RepID=UPI0020CA130F|nr:TIGR02301 family protein [Phenylobacterium sp. LH3H17]UTP39038.1 TIGR02301 family protein [Phenylobacterium sp. LH3H17]